MTATECTQWIEKMYGPIKATHANGVFVMAVPVYGGIAFGCGSCASNSAWDLYCDLKMPGSRMQPSGFHFLLWERERRERLDRLHAEQPKDSPTVKAYRTTDFNGIEIVEVPLRSESEGKK